ncbi:MAG TPA: hypothetical protein VMU17_00960, partial [Elusimicrobiota bacterium]|nr:hypothetical protein [Elusimicrobiota bacterium]
TEPHWPTTINAAVYWRLEQAFRDQGGRDPAVIQERIRALLLDAVLSHAGVASQNRLWFFRRMFDRHNKQLRSEKPLAGAIDHLRLSLKTQPRLLAVVSSVRTSAHEIWSELNALLGMDGTPEIARFLRWLKEALDGMMADYEDAENPDLNRTEDQWLELRPRVLAALRLGRIEDVMGALLHYTLATPYWEMTMAQTLAYAAIENPRLIDDIRELVGRLRSAELASSFERDVLHIRLNAATGPLFENIDGMRQSQEKPPWSREQERFVTTAARDAIDAHIEQFRDNGDPYMVHLMTVANILVSRFRITDPVLVAVALQHDILEDQAETYAGQRIIRKIIGGWKVEPEDLQLKNLGIRMLSLPKGVYSAAQAQQLYWSGLREPWTVFADDPYFARHPNAAKDPTFLAFVRGVQLIKLSDRIHNWTDFGVFLQGDPGLLVQPASGRPQRAFHKTFETMLPQFVNHPDSSASIGVEATAALYDGLKEALFVHARLDVARYPTALPLRDAALSSMEPLAKGIEANPYYPQSEDLKQIVRQLREFGIEDLGGPAGAGPLPSAGTGNSAASVSDGGKALAAPPTAKRDKQRHTTAKAVLSAA